MSGAQAEPTYKLSLSIPREPSAYVATDHFRFRYSRRDNPTITDDVVETCIREGRIKNTQSPDRFIFEATIEGYRWWVIVELVEDAFLDDAEKHRVITAYVPDHPGHDTSEEAWSI
ncbi:hypothetical protein ACFQH6_20545 [Halobacteriaceae archaeon GCM10025711]